MKSVINVEIWNIVAHIAFKFYPDASGTFSTASTPCSAARIPRRSEAERVRQPWRQLASPLFSQTSAMVSSISPKELVAARICGATFQF